MLGLPKSCLKLQIRLVNSYKFHNVTLLFSYENIYGGNMIVVELCIATTSIFVTSSLTSVGWAGDLLIEDPCRHFV
jgi:hypothetical protein